MRMKNREEAGERLATLLRDTVRAPATVYALPRGGVPVALAIARTLHLPLDLVITRKLGHPHQPEYAIGAVTEHGEPVLNDIERGRVDPAWLDARIAAERREARRRREAYCGGRGRQSARDRTAILVDDGVATGLTLEAAVRDIRADRPARIVVAVGVAPRETVARFRGIVDEVVTVLCPDYYAGAVGCYYEDFHQLSDEDVVAQMASLHADAAGH